MTPKKKQAALEALDRVGLTKDGVVTAKGAEYMEKLKTMPSVYQKHHYREFSEDRSTLGGFAKLIVAEGEGHSTCTRCGVFVVYKMPGGLKFWVGGKLTTKRPPCEVPA